MEYRRKLQGITLPFLKLRPSPCILFQSSGIPQLINWSIDSKSLKKSYNITLLFVSLTKIFKPYWLLLGTCIAFMLYCVKMHETVLLQKCFLYALN